MITIYKASAGAGKTHKLTGEYINLLFGDPYAYKHILAVTFTNKATDEMKGRIVEELYNLAANERSDYLNELVKRVGKDEKYIRKVARETLIKILHDYSLFSISTIDRFFQGVMRAFAREVGKMALYNVEIDEGSVIQSAVDMMYLSLDKEDNSDLLKWLIDFSIDVIESGGNWNIKREILSLSGKLFSEEFRIKSREAGTDTFSVDEYRENIARLKERIFMIISDFKTECRRIGRAGIEFMSARGHVPEDYKGASRSPFKIIRQLSDGIIPTLTDSFIALYGAPDKWVGKKDADRMALFYDERLNSVIGEVIEHYNRRSGLYHTALLISENINSLGILGDIYSRIQSYCKEKNIILISETTELLNRIIDGNDTPFIYEKTGTRLDNFMLDEFQDTSRMQWENFKPLLIESLAKGGENLIVGDVKQSIYRWRNSDWKILNSEISSCFRSDELSFSSLISNWRSASDVINFNNSFFKKAAETAQAEYNDSIVYSCTDKSDNSGGDKIAHNNEDNLITSVYTDFEQKIPDKRAGVRGYVECTFFQREEKQGSYGRDKTEENSLSGEERQLGFLKRIIGGIIERGFERRDIAVLVRKNDEGAAVASYLASNGFRIVSNDSLFISSSYSVQKILNILRTLYNPDDNILKISVVFNGGGVHKEEILADSGLSEMPLYNACEQIVRKYLSENERGDAAYIQAFLDCVLEYVNGNGSDLAAFLKWWDESGNRKTISSPDTDAINILTIHKSKGLGFRFVIVPFFKCSFEPASSGLLPTKIWCTTDNPEIGYKGPLPLAYKQALKETLFRNNYIIERNNYYVDTVNLAYVAFTRAKDELYVLSMEPKFTKEGEYKINSVSTLLYNYFSNNEDLQLCLDPEPLTESFHLGKQNKNVESASYIGKEEQQRVKGENKDSFIEIEPAIALRDELDPRRSRTAMQSGSLQGEDSIRIKGIAMHALFSYVNSSDDIHAAVIKALHDGLSEDSESELEKKVTEMIVSVAQYGWFNSSNKVLNEIEIIETNGIVSRPDRVIIRPSGEVVIVDYKFGSCEDNSSLSRYMRQVGCYMGIFRKMGYSNVSGYIWYPFAGKTISVNY